MSIYNNIAFGVKLFEKLSNAEMDDRVEWALNKAALWNEVKINFTKMVLVYLEVSNSGCVLPEVLQLSQRFYY